MKIRKTKLLIIVIIAIFTLFFFGCTANNTKVSKITKQKKLKAASWEYLGGKTPTSFNFKYINILYIGPGYATYNAATKTYSFNVPQSMLSKFLTVIKLAKKENPNIKIILSQWYIFNHNLSIITNTKAIASYAKSVTNFITKYKLNGYGVDYEQAYHNGWTNGNVVKNFPTLIKTIRNDFNKVNPNYLITVSPAATKYLKNAVQYINYCNVQNYDGWSTIAQYTNLGFKTNQIFYGVSSENHGKKTSNTQEINFINNALKNAHTKKLAGIFTWRLNSSTDTLNEDYAQQYLWNQIHNGK